MDYIEYCYCGHTGGTAVSQHEPRYSPGHGPCAVKGCKCEQFTFKSRVKLKAPKPTPRPRR